MTTTRILVLALSLLSPASLMADKHSKTNVIFIFADDWGYGDLGAHEHLTDVKTPHLDALSQQGVLFTDAYITAPQCSPSRAGLVTGRYQQRFGFDHIPDGPLPLNETTIAQRLSSAGYKTGMVGKWHLEPNPVCVEWARKHQPDGIKKNRVAVRQDLSRPYWPQARGFDEFFKGEMNRYWCNYALDSSDLNREGEWVDDPRFRVDVQTEAGLAFIERNADKPFFLYLAHYAPHVPLEATEKYLSRFPGEMPERRRTGLAMINAVDEGVGRIMQLLREKGIADNTLVIFTSDNGAPLKIHKLDAPGGGPGWDGSLNDPLTGEKGMVAEGGIRVPMIWSWPARLLKGKTINEPVISLDMTVSAVAAAGVEVESTEKLDGVNLIPWLSGNQTAAPDRSLFWRFWSQSAVRNGDWKLIVTGDGRELLFNIRDDKEEQRNLAVQHPQHAAQLKSELLQWTHQLQPVGLPTKPLNNEELGWYDHYFQSTPAASRQP
ncbi:sulfatase-like hydrolase/transferase [Aporhodopirellula aestuarii]|uniref:Sulfatase-like hydrolase/transferase n=1 Tax=Aporhodopirellula aestuarii TaxID=2950107 RepID=A0ABT0UD91_9BACT|nr:sulfatase-like hydrolase/transferase [Aporhodopirellula aestuarii]MCM2374762.1 sulfatase-like hydrolase/transferase [Aporhodopirellula aestuarii]